MRQLKVECDRESGDSRTHARADRGASISPQAFPDRRIDLTEVF
jgi:hypothetical protein